MRPCRGLAQVLARRSLASSASFTFRSLGAGLNTASSSTLISAQAQSQWESRRFHTNIGSKRFLRTDFHRRQNTGMTTKENNDGWQTFGNYDVYAWSLSGIESCVVVRADGLKIAFDMGHSIPQSIGCANVFISHGHVDHIGGVTGHASKRGLFSMKRALYHVPRPLVASLRTVTDASFAMSTTEALRDVQVVPFDLTDTVTLPGGYSVLAFPTVHRVASQGYILYRTVKRLKDQYRGQPSAAIAQLHRDNVDIHDIITTPEIAYTGDTMVEVFRDPPCEDLLRVKLLMTEATYLDPGDGAVGQARARGHCHLQELADNADLFTHVDHILLMHFSTKYSVPYITQALAALPPTLRGKVSCATVAKERS